MGRQFFILGQLVPNWNTLVLGVAKGERADKKKGGHLCWEKWRDEPKVVGLSEVTPERQSGVVGMGVSPFQLWMDRARLLSSSTRTLEPPRYCLCILLSKY